MTVSSITTVTQCNKLPSRVQAIASELEQLFLAANPHYKQVQPNSDKPSSKVGARGLRALLSEDKHKRALEMFKRPVDLANYDCNLFLAKYFLDLDGTPDPPKVPFPVLLPGLSDRLAMQQAADGIPGLKTSSGGEGDFRILVLGWNRAAIFEVAEKISTDQERLRDALSPTWQENLQEHYRLIKKHRLSSKLRKFAIESAQGTYAIECRGRVDIYDHDDNDSSLRITYSEIDGWVGIFRIGVIHGVMRLDTDGKALLARCKATEKNESRIDECTEMQVPLEELETTEEEEGYSEEEDVFSGLSEGEEDEEEVSDSYGLVVVGMRRKRRRAPSEAREGPAKRSKSSSRNRPNRLYFKWRGREQGEGDVAYDFRKKNTGYLQFTDATCTKFDGTISNELIGENVRFQGFKISNDGGAVTKTYREYSERAGKFLDD